MTDTLATTDFELIVESFEESEEQCESTLHMIEWRMPPHAAHWYASSPCLSLVAVCDARKRKCLRDGSWQCVHGCSAEHPYDQIEWTEIP